MNRVRKSIVQPRFTVGNRVRVRVGVMDPDFPSISLGNCSGTVSQVEEEKQITYLVEWSPQVLDRVHPTCKDYCQQRDIAFDKMWLLEEDLEPDAAYKTFVTPGMGCG